MTSNARSSGIKDTREGGYSYLLPIIYNQTITLPVKSLFGIESTLPITIDESGFSEMLSAGSVWFRRNGVMWSEIEGEQGTYNWDVLQSFEQEILLASERSINLIPVIRGTPPWAQLVPGYACGPIKLENLDDFSNFLYEFVSRYSLPPFNLKYIEIWNEPDIQPMDVNPHSGYGCWGNPDDEYYGGGYYAEMLKAIYPRMKAANSSIQIIVGGLLLDCDPDNIPRHKTECNSAKFFEGILRNGGGGYFDGVGFHSYDYTYSQYYYENPNWHASSIETGPVLVVKAAFLRNLLENYGYRNKYLINSETALLCSNDCNGDEQEMALAYYLSKSYAYASVVGLRASLWYSILGWLGSGLLQPNLTQLPAYRSFHFASLKHQGIQFMESIHEYPGVYGMKFAGNSSLFWVIWSLDGSEINIQLPRKPTAIWDALGNPQPSGTQLIVTAKPLYIDW